MQTVESSTHLIPCMIHCTLCILQDSPFLLIFSRGDLFPTGCRMAQTFGTIQMTPKDSRSIPAVKAGLRERFRAYRAGLTLKRYRELSALIIEATKILPEVLEAANVHVYWPMIDDREIDTRPLVRWLEARGQTIILPRIVDFERTAGTSPRIEHIRYPGESELRINRWGIAEPPPGDEVSVSIIDVVIVPALGAGRNGHRIGHGFGYYDDFLAATPAPRVVLVYDACLLDHVPSEPHDVPANVVISERALVRIPPM